MEINGAIWRLGQNSEIKKITKYLIAVVLARNLDML
jgi:hypothetical protein